MLKAVAAIFRGVATAAFRLSFVAAVGAFVYLHHERIVPDVPVPPKPVKRYIIGGDSKPEWIYPPHISAGATETQIQPQRPVTFNPRIPVVHPPEPDKVVRLPLRSKWRGVIQLDGTWREVVLDLCSVERRSDGKDTASRLDADISILADGKPGPVAHAEGEAPKTGLVRPWEDPLNDNRIWLHAWKEGPIEQLAGAVIALTSFQDTTQLSGSYYVTGKPKLVGKIALALITPEEKTP